MAAQRAAMVVQRAIEHLAGLAEAVRQAPPDPVVYLGNDLYERPSTGEKIRLTGVEAQVMESLVDLGAAEKARLRQYSGLDDESAAVNALRTIRKKFPILRPHVILPGGRNKGGYRTTVTRK
jgi:hypothetical protein